MDRDVCVAAAITCSPVGDLAANVANLARWVREAARQKAEIVCFPELNLTGYTTRKDLLAPLAQPVPGPLTDQLVALAAETNVTILAGLAEKDGPRQIFATHVVVPPDGACQVYRKLHLARPEQGLFQPGDRAPLFDLGGIRVGIQICYDAHFPGLSTAMALGGADILFMPHASPRGEPDEKRASWMRHLPARAFDNGVFVVACNPVGDNGCGLSFPGLGLVFGPNGKLIAQTLTRSETMLVVHLKSRQLKALRHHPLAYFLPHRRTDLYGRQ